jgi:hypothetical protein
MIPAEFTFPELAVIPPPLPPVELVAEDLLFDLFELSLNKLFCPFPLPL